MTVKFDPYAPRERVAGMLEGPARKLARVFNDAKAHAEVTAILAELDRLDRVTAAKAKLAANRSKWQREVIAEDIKIVPADEGAICTETTTWFGWKQVSHVHKAKVTLNGKPYCLTHLKRAEEKARTDVLYVKRAKEYVEDPELRAILDAHDAVVALRRGR